MIQFTISTFGDYSYSLYLISLFCLIGMCNTIWTFIYPIGLTPYCTLDILHISGGLLPIVLATPKHNKLRSIEAAVRRRSSTKDPANVKKELAAHIKLRRAVVFLWCWMYVQHGMFVHMLTAYLRFETTWLHPLLFWHRGCPIGYNDSCHTVCERIYGSFCGNRSISDCNVLWRYFVNILWYTRFHLVTLFLFQVRWYFEYYTLWSLSPSKKWLLRSTTWFVISGIDLLFACESPFMVNYHAPDFQWGQKNDISPNPL